jgi:hypothetical protein
MLDRVTMTQPPHSRAKPISELLKAEILAAIGEHIREHGRRDWAKMREQPEFAEVIGAAAGPSGDRRFWRWVKQIDEPIRPRRVGPQDGPAAEHAAWSEEQAAQAVRASLPAAPPASFFMRRGADGLVQVDMLSAAAEIWHDLMLAREEAFKAGRDGSRTLKSAKALTANAGMRIKALQSITLLMRQVFEIARLYRLYEAIVRFLSDELKEEPERLARLLERLRQINEGDAPSIADEA